MQRKRKCGSTELIRLTFSFYFVGGCFHAIFKSISNKQIKFIELRDPEEFLCFAKFIELFRLKFLCEKNILFTDLVF